MTLRKILVPLDGSPFCEHALPHAASIARRTGARLILAHVQPPATTFISIDSQSALTPYEESDVEQSMKAYLDKTAAALRPITGGAVSTAYRTGHIVDTLCELIHSEGIDLVTITTHGRGSLSRMWLGSIASELTQRSPIPLLLTRPTETPSELHADVVPRRILIPLDGSPFAEKAIPLAFSFGSAVGSSPATIYRLLQVVPPVLTTASIKEHSILAASPTVADELRTQAEAYFRDLTQRMPPLQHAETHVAVDWPAANAIL
ncbi:MAG TPA: universal stress protein, partial [Gemmatales bacterium]|nr:universal stress protein [Gemmatales bacterium]